MTTDHPTAPSLSLLGADAALLIGKGTFRHGDDFTSRFIHYGTTNGTPMAVTNR